MSVIKFEHEKTACRVSRAKITRKLKLKKDSLPS